VPEAAPVKTQIFFIEIPFDAKAALTYIEP
jgi:hypothetical protein